MSVAKQIEQARKATGYGYRRLARLMTAEGFPVDFRQLYRWSQGRGPLARIEPDARATLARIIEANKRSKRRKG